MFQQNNQHEPPSYGILDDYRRLSVMAAAMAGENGGHLQGFSIKSTCWYLLGCFAGWKPRSQAKLLGNRYVFHMRVLNFMLSCCLSCFYVVCTVDGREWQRGCSHAINAARGWSTIMDLFWRQGFLQLHRSFLTSHRPEDAASVAPR